jgi:hypothetical protein
MIALVGCVDREDGIAVCGGLLYLGRTNSDWVGIT